MHLSAMSLPCSLAHISIMKLEIALESDLGFSIKGLTKDIRIP